MWEIQNARQNKPKSITDSFSLKWRISWLGDTRLCWMIPDNKRLWLYFLLKSGISFQLLHSFKVLNSHQDFFDGFWLRTLNRPNVIFKVIFMAWPTRNWHNVIKEFYCLTPSYSLTSEAKYFLRLMIFVLHYVIPWHNTFKWAIVDVMQFWLLRGSCV